MPTQKDIAQKLNLSRSLVGAVLNNKAGEWVSPETKQRIREAASQLNYHPHAAAKALRSGKTQTVVFHFFPPAPSSRQHIGSLIETLAEELGVLNFKLHVNVAVEGKDAFLESLLTGVYCDAVILLGSEEQIEPPAQRLFAANVPFVVVSGAFEDHPEWFHVDFDHEEMMEQSVAYLVARGHRRIGYLGHDHEKRYARKLLHGFQRAIGRRSTQGVRTVGIGRTLNAQNTRAVLEQWFSLPEKERPTSVVISAPDEMVWQELEIYLARYGRVIGEGANDFNAVGLYDSYASLSYGEALAFRLQDRTQMAQELVRGLVGPMLQNRPVKNAILGVLPPLEPLPSRKLLEATRWLLAARP